MYHYIGSLGCKLHWLANGIHNANSIFGELSIAIYRLMAVKYSRSKFITVRPTLKFALLSLVTYSTYLAISFFLGIDYVGKALTLEFCHGYSSNMSQTLNRHYHGLSDGDISFGSFLFQAMYVVGQLAIVARLGCYLLIFRHLKKHNDNSKLKSMLPTKELQQRHEKNVFTLYGEVVIFAQELFFSVIFYLLLFSDFQMFPTGSYSIMIMVLTAVVSVVRITMASPELRRFYF